MKHRVKVNVAVLVAVLELLPGEDETLLVKGSIFFVLYLAFSRLCPTTRLLAGWPCR